MMKIEFAIIDDIDMILDYDEHVSLSEMNRLIENKRCIVAKSDEIIFGFARWNLFWDNTPFLNMLYVPDGYNRMGIGSQLLTFWENEMKKQGYSILLTSTQANEKGQHFFRKRGYQDCGNLILPKESLELILYKEV